MLSIQFNLGVSQARSQDAKLIKQLVVGWLSEFDGAGDLHPMVKESRGFNNPVTGAFSCPITVDWEDPRCVN